MMLLHRPCAQPNMRWNHINGLTYIGTKVSISPHTTLMQYRGQCLGFDELMSGGKSERISNLWCSLIDRLWSRHRSRWRLYVWSPIVSNVGFPSDAKKFSKFPHKVQNPPANSEISQQLITGVVRVCFCFVCPCTSRSLVPKQNCRH